MFYISQLSPHSSLLFLILYYYLSSLNVVEFLCRKINEFLYFYIYISVQYHKTSANIQQKRTKKNYASVH